MTDNIFIFKMVTLSLSMCFSSIFQNNASILHKLNKKITKKFIMSGDKYFWNFQYQCNKLQTLMINCETW